MKSPAHFLLWLVCFYFPISVMGHSIVNTEDQPFGYIKMEDLAASASHHPSTMKESVKAEKRQFRLQKQLQRVEQYFQSRMEKKKLGNISDPVDKWFWFWGISWGLGILLSVLTAGAIVGTGIGIIWWLLFAIGSVSLVIWLVKKFG